MDMDTAELERLLQQEIARLADEFRGVFSPESIDRCARDSLDRLQNVRVRRYLPLFAYRFTRERLQALAGAVGIIRSPNPRVLFVCGQNAGRSQMAAALTRHLSNQQVRASSAGSHPAPAVHQAMITVMAG